MKKICFISGSRADFGLLLNLMLKVKINPKLIFQLIVVGPKIFIKNKYIIREIKKNKIKINYKVNLNFKQDNSENICNAMAQTIKKVSDKIQKLKPDLIVLLGDRFEIFAACSAAYIHRIPVCHLHGGELSLGSLDDGLRHAITKMSNLHFVANKIYARRVKQLGEDPNKIFVTGGFGTDLIINTKLLKKGELERKIGIKFGKKNLLVTYHPETIDKTNPKQDFSQLLKALNYFDDTNIIFTKTNPDIFGSIINKMIDKYVSKNKKKRFVFTSMGQTNYLSSVKFVDCVIGNSSSGITEVPYFKKPTINIGKRQNKRLSASSVINVKPNYVDIVKAIKKIYKKKLSKKLKNIKNPYGRRGASQKAIEIILSYKKKNLDKKNFFDI